MAMNNTKYILDLHYGDQAVSHSDLNAGKELKSLWFEIPEYCHLYCDYCFASTNSDVSRNKLFGKKANEYLNWDQYEKLLRDFSSAGGKYIGIPGRGEPFHPKNLELAKKIIDLAVTLNLQTTIFTTGETIFFRPDYSSQNELSLDTKPDFELMNYLSDKNIILLVKFNSEKEEIQDKLVHTKNYTRLRTRAIDLLLENGFNQGKKPRLGIVTSILKDNLNEIIYLYRKYHKEKGLIFDCDTILPRGRGEVYFNREDNLTYKELNQIFHELKSEGAILNCQGGTYVGVACDRILHHLYVSLTGNVYPCIGCFENGNKADFKLGNIKTSGIAELWDSPKRVKLREKPRDAFSGVCFNCQNFENNSCFSCLGRCTKNVKSNDSDIIIETHGCTNHKPVFSSWVNDAVDYVRNFLSFEETRQAISQNLENIWKPNQNIAFVLHQLSTGEQGNEISKIIGASDPHDRKYYRPDDIYKKVPVKSFSLKKHYKYSDLDFPLNKVWDFIKPPSDLQVRDNDFGKLMNELSKSFLSNVFLPSIRVLFEKHDYEKGNFLICNLLFYDNSRKEYFYRTISKNETEEDEDLYRKSIVLFRWAENFDGANYYSHLSKGKCLNLSDILRKSFYRDYELVLVNNQSILEGSKNIYDLSDFIYSGIIVRKVKQLDDYFSEHIFGLKGTWESIEPLINSKIFNELGIEEKSKLSDFYEKLNTVAFYKREDKEILQSEILTALKEFVKKGCNKLSSTSESANSINDFIGSIDSEYRKKYKAVFSFIEFFKDKDLVPMINYLVFLGYLHHKMGINYYYLLHSTNFKTVDSKHSEMSDSSSEYSNVIKPSGILLCTKRQLNRDLRSDMKLFTSNIFQPFDEYFFEREFMEKEEATQQNEVNKKFQEKIEAHRHTLLNLINGLEPSRKEMSPNETYLKNGINYAFILAEDICTIEEERFRIGEKLSEKPEIILKELCEFFKSNPSATMKLNDSIIEKSKTELTPVQRLDFLTIMFNLIHNAKKSDSMASFNSDFNYYLYGNEDLNGNFIVTVKNPAVMENEVKDFLNDSNVNLITYKYAGRLKPTGGVTIIKKILKSCRWVLDVVADNTKKETEISLKIKIL